MTRLYGLGLVIGMGLTACAAWPDGEDASEEQPSQAPVQPVDAFEKVGEPKRQQTGIGSDSDNLSKDIERLQDARRQYEHDRARQSAERKRRQAECRDTDRSQQVRIDDGSGEPGTYCQQTP